jgi:hypothetical protein
MAFSCKGIEFRRRIWDLNRCCRGMSGCQIDECTDIVDVHIGLTQAEENLLGDPIAPQADWPDIETRGIFLDQPAWQGGHAAAIAAVARERCSLQ